MMAERGVLLAHTTIFGGCSATCRTLKSSGRRTPDRWATPGVWMKPTSKSKANGSTSIAPSISRAEPSTFSSSKRRDVATAKRFFSRAAKQHGAPRVITLDGYAASHRAVDKLKTSGTLPRRVQVRSCKYLNNVIEQDHRRIKQRIRPMLGFKRFETAAVTICGIELAEKIKKQQLPQH